MRRDAAARRAYRFERALSFQLGANTALDTDASSSGIGSGFGRPQNNSNSPFSRGNQGGLDGMFGCEIRAAYPGYRSDSVPWRTGTRSTIRTGHDHPAPAGQRAGVDDQPDHGGGAETGAQGL